MMSKPHSKATNVCSECKGTQKCPYCDGSGIRSITRSDQWGEILNECMMCLGSGDCLACDQERQHKPSNGKGII